MCMRMKLTWIINNALDFERVEIEDVMVRDEIEDVGVVVCGGWSKDLEVGGAVDVAWHATW